ncbi:MAG TPA: glycosyltransferase [Candidatus Acidoferrum sp.]|nr:glycosyltransferase [Candidatus Acidoferrum sp.]
MPNTFCPQVSIITATYNHEQFVETCVHSVLQQTYSNWEQIVIDDGSPDNTANIVSGIRDPRIRVERQANQSAFELAKTYNRALSLASGELIAILEGDDFWPPDKLATLVPAFLDNDTVLAYGEAADVDARGLEQRIKSHTTRLREGLSHSILFNDPPGSATNYMLLAEGRSLVSPSTVVIRRSALEKVGGFQYVAGLPLTDYPTFMELSLIGKFCYSPEKMGYRRRHENSVTVGHARTIHEKVSGFTMGFLERHHEKIELSPSTRQELEQNWQQAQDKLHFSEGRSLLLQRKWSEARNHFRIASTSKKLSVRLASFAGLLFSWVHADIEPLMRLGGRADLRT